MRMELTVCLRPRAFGALEALVDFVLVVLKIDTSSVIIQGSEGLLMFES